MSKVVNINAQATYASPIAPIVITNIYDPTKDVVDAMSELDLPLKADDVWNTGLASVGDPHIDEIARGASDTAIVTDANTWTAKHIASFRLFKTNSFVYLLPGDSITVAAQSPEEALYYGTLRNEFLSVTDGEAEDPANPIVVPDKEKEHPESETKFAAQLNRTTGVGDADDGDENTIYPFGFDTEAATNGELDAEATEGEAEGGEGGEGNDNG